MRLRSQILLFLFLFGLAPLIASVALVFPMILGGVERFYHEGHLQNLRADFRDLDQHLASRNESVRLLAKNPEPGALLDSASGNSSLGLEIARARYAGWLNRVLHDQLDIIQILFLDNRGNEQFWLERDRKTLALRPSQKLLDKPPRAFLEAAMRLNPGGFLVSPISINPQAAEQDPRRFMMLRLVSPIVGHLPLSKSPGEPVRPIGAVVINIDVGGLARAFRDTYWVHNDGSYLRSGEETDSERTAFQDFPGLEESFAKGRLALWKGKQDEQVIWVPMFATERSEPLWVGRRVDPSPIADFRHAIETRVIWIGTVLIALVLLVARWSAVRAERFGRELTDGIGRVIKYDEPVRFSWRGPEELKTLGENLSQLAETHARNSRALRAHAEELEESNRYKSEFLANVSHELRTPLNSILLLSKMLADKENDQLSPEQVKQARVIHQAGADLSALIDDILDLSRIEARQTVFRIASVDLEGTIRETMDLVRPQYDQKGIKLDLVVKEDAPRAIMSDEEKLRQILKNFLSNAMKFTAEGGVTVTLAANRGDDAAMRPARISVRDTGIGIPGDKHDVIFEAFKQADGSTSRRFGGTGLGLTISRELATLMGGRIELESEIDRGSDFSLLLPLDFDRSLVAPERVTAETSPSPAKPLERMPDADFRQKHILVIDDDVRNLVAITPVLERWGLKVTAAGDGNEALETLAEDGEFDAVLLDMLMPDMDGYETITRIRAEDRFQNLPVIALTAKGDRAERNRCLALGIDDLISKPVDPAALKDALARYMQSSSRNRERRYQDS